MKTKPHGWVARNRSTQLVFCDGHYGEMFYVDHTGTWHASCGGEVLLGCPGDRRLPEIAPGECKPVWLTTVLEEGEGEG